MTLLDSLLGGWMRSQRPAMPQVAMPLLTFQDPKRKRAVKKPKSLLDNSLLGSLSF